MWIAILLCSNFKYSVDIMHMALSLMTHMMRSISPTFSLAAALFTSLLSIFADFFQIPYPSSLHSQKNLAYDFTIFLDYNLSVQRFVLLCIWQCTFYFPE